MDSNIESLFIEIDNVLCTSNSRVIVGFVYRPPNSNMMVFLEKMKHILETINNQKHTVYVMGDFNLNLLTQTDSGNSSGFLEMFYSNNFLPLINRPTRVTQKTATLIDNIFTNNLDVNRKFHNGILYTDISDHFPVFHISEVENLQRQEKRSIYIRNHNLDNLTAFKNALSMKDWSDLYSITDPQAASTFFHNDMNMLLNSCLPLKKVTLKLNRRSPWITNGLRKSINKKNRLYKDSNSSVEKKQTYITYRNRLTHLLRIAKKEYYNTLLLNYKNDLKKSWQVLNDIINKRKRKNKLPMKFKHNNTYISDPQIIANQFNKYYINVGPTLAAKIPPQTSDPILNMKGTYTNSMFLRPITLSEINTIIDNL